MALNSFKCNYPIPLHFKGLKRVDGARAVYCQSPF